MEVGNYPKNWDSSVGNSRKTRWLIISLCTHSVIETHSVKIKYNRLFAWQYPQNCLFLHIYVDVNSMEKKEYRNRIRVILAEKMITNTYLAEQLGVSKMTISRWCTNTTQPSAPQLIEISRILQCDLKELYETIE